tara:strand:- start:1943 stop:2692 length:750 start_codon:yes stop_codon:yes gene_type:complete
MKRSMIIVLGTLSLIPIWLLAASHDESQPMPGVESATEFTPTNEYHRLEIHGWPVLVNPSLDDHPVLRKDTIDLLSDQLYRTTRKVPQPALDRIRKIEIWVELDMPKTACMCYHVSRDWLIPNGYNPDKEGAVEVGDARAFLEWTKGQPWMVLHELSHGYHDQVFGYDDPSIIAAWQNKVDAGDYEEVLHISGVPRKHYALTNQMEYFAETTESYFGCNDFHPFVKGELMAIDPAGYELMRKTWIDKGD